jgi:hypothetical protein
METLKVKYNGEVIEMQKHWALRNIDAGRATLVKDNPKEQPKKKPGRKPKAKEEKPQAETKELKVKAETK